MNNGIKVYLQREQQARLCINAEMFKDMMQAGSYFLHLKEFADCMRRSQMEGGAGLILQSFAQAVGDFLQSYQARVLDFGNQVKRRRLGETLFLSGGIEGDHSLLELIVHMEPQIAQLRLLSNICFTQKFINNIVKVKQEQ